MPLQAFDELRDQIIHCRRCPRLVDFREHVPAKKAFENERYWRRPLPGFGDEKAWLLITGLAPSAHGGNRTGRLFTGDATSQFLFKALCQIGFANQESSISKADGLQLQGCYLTAVVKCAPPGDKPTAEECLNCNPYYQQELQLLTGVTHILALGRVAFQSILLTARLKGVSVRGATFQHGGRYQFESFPTIYASYHPSPQNTNTGKLSLSDFVNLLHQIKKDGKSPKIG